MVEESLNDAHQNHLGVLFKENQIATIKILIQSVELWSQVILIEVGLEDRGKRLEFGFPQARTERYTPPAAISEGSQEIGSQGPRP